MSESEFDTEHGQRVRNDREVKPSVPCTAVRQLAQACAAAICDGASIEVLRYSEGNRMMIVEMSESEVAELIAKTLDANHETMCEATRANA